MSIQSQINRIGNEVTAQSSLISQIKTALQGKVSGGGGGANIETCTVTATATGFQFYGAVAPIYENGIITYYINESAFSNLTIENVIKGNFILLFPSSGILGSSLTTITLSDGIELLKISSASAGGYFIINSDGTISVDYD